MREAISMQSLYQHAITLSACNHSISMQSLRSIHPYLT